MGAAVGEMVYVPYGGKLQEGKVVKHVTLDSGEKAITVRFSVAGRVAKEESFPPAAVQSQNASEQLKLVLPDGLRWQLVNDWEQVCKTKLPVPLPRRPAVMDILYNFREATRDARGYTRNELVISLQEYFDDALPGLLLYAGEEELYRNAKFDRNKSPSAIYGAEHLLRLLVKLPELLSATDVLEGKIHRIQTQVNDLVMFLDANQAAFFLTRYGVPYD